MALRFSGRFIVTQAMPSSNSTSTVLPPGIGADDWVSADFVVTGSISLLARTLPAWRAVAKSRPIDYDRRTTALQHEPWVETRCRASCEPSERRSSHVCASDSAGATASAFPDKPIRLLVSFPPGGSTDAMARIVQPGVEKLLGQPLVIENRPGAGGLIAIDAVAKSAPDGYVIGLGGTAALGSNHGISGETHYDVRKDVAPVTGLAGSPFILAAPPSFQGKSLRDVIALAKAQGDKLTIGHGGNGTLMHLTAELFNQMAGTKARARSLPRHGAGGDRPDRQPCGVRHHRSALRDVGDRGRQDQAGRGHLGQALRRACPTFRPSRSPACRASSPTARSASWRPPARRPT